MKRSKHGNYHKVVAFVLIAIVIISAVGFVANGWQPILDSEADNDDAVNNSGEITDSGGDNADDVPVVAPPKFYSYLTGLETTEEAEKTIAIAFLTDPELPLYGASSASLTIEFPIEGGKTRLLVYSECATSLGKIGPIMPTRDYISEYLLHFKATLLSSGNDDVIEYPSKEFKGGLIDISAISGYHYTEGESAFTNADLLRAALRTSGIDTSHDGQVRLPFSFVDVGSSNLAFDNPASEITIPQGSSGTTSLVLNGESGRYLYQKNGSAKSDMLNASEIAFDNVFVLFMDSVTYETSKGTELVLATTGSGNGYYATAGTYTAIKWVCDGDTLTLYDEQDNKLLVNRGTSFFALVKSTEQHLVTFS